MAALCAAIRDWTVVLIPCGDADLDQLVCYSKTLRGPIVRTAGGGSLFHAQDTLNSVTLGVAIRQSCYATGEAHERAVLRQLLRKLDLEGVLIKAERCIPSARFSAAPGAGDRLEMGAFYWTALGP